MIFVNVFGVELNMENWDEMEGWKEVVCFFGILVLIYGVLLILNIYFVF